MLIIISETILKDMVLFNLHIGLMNMLLNPQHDSWSTKVWIWHPMIFPLQKEYSSLFTCLYFHLCYSNSSWQSHPCTLKTPFNTLSLSATICSLHGHESYSCKTNLIIILCCLKIYRLRSAAVFASAPHTYYP